MNFYGNSSVHIVLRLFLCMQSRIITVFSANTGLGILHQELTKLCPKTDATYLDPYEFTIDNDFDVRMKSGNTENCNDMLASNKASLDENRPKETSILKSAKTTKVQMSNRVPLRPEAFKKPNLLAIERRGKTQISKGTFFFGFKN